MQLEWARHILGRVLILAPLAVAEQTVMEGARFDIPLVYDRTGHAPDRIVITNYEMLEHFNPADFAGVVLDESSILKAFDGKTRTRLIEAFQETPYRLACTATPAPNDYMELGNHAEFLGIMTRTEMLATFFVHDGGETQQWALKGHGAGAFWKWVASWAVMIQKPSDLGFSDENFILPDLRIKHIVVESDNEAAHERGLLFNLEAQTLAERRDARKATIELRAQAVADLVKKSQEPWLIWCNLNAEGDLIEELLPDAVQIAGSDSLEDKKGRMLGFAAGEFKRMISKPSICGWGMNWQHCNNVVFFGLSDSYEQFYQALRRCWRFGQTKPVNCYVVISDTERAVLRNIERKEEDAKRMAAAMVESMKENMIENVSGAQRDDCAYEERTATGRGWTMNLGDCVEVIQTIPSHSIDYTIFSPPFANLYAYSNSERDMGNARTHSEFYEHFKFLVPELLRVTKPGRLLSFHCMNLPTSKMRDGVIGLTDFRGLLIQMFMAAGWIYHSEVVIWKDPVTAVHRTKALGLLHKQLKKDSAMCRQGIPDYLVTMRAPGDNPDRITHTNETFPVALWQRYASPVWFDINASDTLEFREARDDDDEKHICPLQLGVIERALKLWTNPKDLVLSPFAGIGSEGYVALREGRQFVGIELKDSYWKVACGHLQRAAESGGQLSIFPVAEGEGESA
jgi:superfamily II DNA or RNA helicase